MTTASLLAVWLLLATPVARVECDATGWRLTAESGGRHRVLVQTAGYQAADAANAPVFATSGAPAGSSPARVAYRLTGAGAPAAEVAAHCQPLPNGVTVDWRLTWRGGQRTWSGWTSGLVHQWGEAPTGATTQALVDWRRPDGTRAGEVAGDTPYPVPGGQIRRVVFGDLALVMVTPTYDPDWIYKRELGRVRLVRWQPVDGEVRYRVTYLVVPAGSDQPADWAATAAGRPLALSLTTGRAAPLFVPGEPLRVQARLANVTAAAQSSTLRLTAYTYRGQPLLNREEPIALAAGADRLLDLTLPPAERGVVFVTARLNWPGGEWTERLNLGILPERRADGVREASPFGLAAVTANPAHYPDQAALETVLPLVERVGCRRIRGGWYPVDPEATDATVAAVRAQLAQLRRHGVLPYVQLPGEPCQAGGEAALTARYRGAIGRFAWASDYVEVGNELNLGGLKAHDYVARLLRPVAAATRQAAPHAKVLSMGFGGVLPDWLNEFVAAGGLDLVDILSIHPGCQPRSPEFWQGWRGWVFRPQVLDALRAARAKGKAVWITEAYAPTVPGRAGLDHRTAADYLVRSYVCALAAGVQHIAWYQFQDGVWHSRRPDADDGEYNYGIVYTDLSPKPAYVAYGAMTEQLEGATYVGRLELGADDLYGVRFRRGDGVVDVLWSCREKHETDVAWWPPEQFRHLSRRAGEPWQTRWRQAVTVPLPAAGSVTVTDLMGNPRTLTSRAGRVELLLDGSPQYATGLGALPLKPVFWE